MWWLLIGFVIGFIVGVNAGGSRWRQNADVPYRIYSWGRLYKVKYADEGKKWGE